MRRMATRAGPEGDAGMLSLVPIIVGALAGCALGLGAYEMMTDDRSNRSRPADSHPTEDWLRTKGITLEPSVGTTAYQEHEWT